MEPIFKRNIEITLDENKDGGIGIRAHMTDAIHDILLTLDVTLPEYTIQNARLEVGMAPGGRCPELCPRIAALNGTQVKHGFSQRIRNLYGGADGCPNVLVMLQAAVPLAINISWAVMARRGIAPEHVKETQNRQMKGVCISFNHSEPDAHDFK